MRQITPLPEKEELEITDLAQLISSSAFDWSTKQIKHWRTWRGEAAKNKRLWDNQKRPFFPLVSHWPFQKLFGMQCQKNSVSELFCLHHSSITCFLGFLSFLDLLQALCSSLTIPGYKCLPGRNTLPLKKGRLPLGLRQNPPAGCPACSSFSSPTTLVSLQHT